MKGLMTAWADVFSHIECHEAQRSSLNTAFVVVRVDARTANFDVVAGLSIHLGDEATATRLARVFAEAAAKLRAEAERDLGLVGEEAP